MARYCSDRPNVLIPLRIEYLLAPAVVHPLRLRRGNTQSTDNPFVVVSIAIRRNGFGDEETANGRFHRHYPGQGASQAISDDNRVGVFIKAGSRGRSLGIFITPQVLNRLESTNNRRRRSTVLLIPAGDRW